MKRIGEIELDRCPHSRCEVPQQQQDNDGNNARSANQPPGVFAYVSADDRFILGGIVEDVLRPPKGERRHAYGNSGRQHERLVWRKVVVQVTGND